MTRYRAPPRPAELWPCVGCATLTSRYCTVCARRLCSAECQKTARCDYDVEEGRTAASALYAQAGAAAQGAEPSAASDALRSIAIDDIVEASPPPSPPRAPSPRIAAAAAAEARAAAAAARRVPASSYNSRIAQIIGSERPERRQWSDYMGAGAGGYTDTALLDYYGRSNLYAANFAVAAPARPSWDARRVRHERLAAALPSDAPKLAWLERINEAGSARSARAGHAKLMVALADPLRGAPLAPGAGAALDCRDEARAQCFLDAQREMVLIEVDGDGTCFLHALLRAHGLETRAPVTTRRLIANEIDEYVERVALKRHAAITPAVVAEAIEAAGRATETAQRGDGKSEQEVQEEVAKARAEAPARLRAAIDNTVANAREATADMRHGTLFMQESNAICEYFQEQLGATVLTLHYVPRCGYRIGHLCSDSNKIETPNVVILAHRGQHWRTIGRYDAATRETRTLLPATDPYVRALVAFYEDEASYGEHPPAQSAAAQVKDEAEGDEQGDEDAAGDGEEGDGDDPSDAWGATSLDTAGQDAMWRSGGAAWDDDGSSVAAFYGDNGGDIYSNIDADADASRWNKWDDAEEEGCVRSDDDDDKAADTTPPLLAPEATWRGLKLIPTVRTVSRAQEADERDDDYANEHVADEPAQPATEPTDEMREERDVV